MKTADMIKKISDLEKQLQGLKLQLFFSGKTNITNEKSIYDEEELIDNVRIIRKQIWDKRYAAKI